MNDGFRLTYSTMFDPPASLHEAFEAALGRVNVAGTQQLGMWIDGAPQDGATHFEVRSPIDRERVLVRMPAGTAADVDRAVRSAHRAFPGWAATPWQQRVRLLRRAAALIGERVYDIAASLALEVGKNRMEAIGEVQETADLIDWYCDRMEAADGFLRVLPDDPLAGYASHNATRLRPYGAWAVIAPFNFPIALAGGPIGAALVTGNTVVFKVASQTAWSGWLLMAVLRDAGLPAGVVNFVTGAGATVGDALAAHPLVAGITFTGSHAVGSAIARAMAGGRWPRPCIAEMGGKNPVIVTRHADLTRAATGIVRSAFGLQGQKCSACSRIYVERPVAADLTERLIALTRQIRIGDPTVRDNWMGPLIGQSALARYRRCVDALRANGSVLTGGMVLDDGPLARGWYAAPTIARAPSAHPLWREEVFLPLALLAEYDTLDEALTLANDSDYGLTAGFYGNDEEAATFSDRIEAGVIYLNRPQGATTGAWPGYQPFGGWKASSSTGKAIGSHWYLTQYLREQSRTIVD